MGTEARRLFSAVEIKYLSSNLLTLFVIEMIMA